MGITSHTRPHLPPHPLPPLFLLVAPLEGALAVASLHLILSLCGLTCLLLGRHETPVPVEQLGFPVLHIIFSAESSSCCFMLCAVRSALLFMDEVLHTCCISGHVVSEGLCSAGSHNNHEAAWATFCCHPAGRRTVVQPGRPCYHATQPGLVSTLALHADTWESGR